MIITVTPNPVLDRTLTVDEIHFDSVLRASTVRLDWGGKGFNVSRALLGLGTQSVAMAFVGGGTGQILVRGLQQLGIAGEFVEIGDETRTNVVVTDRDASHYLKVNEAGPTIAADEQAHFFQQVQARIAPGDIWVLAGSLAPGLPVDFYARLIELIRAGGARAVLDTSGPPLRSGSEAAPYMVKPNAQEAAEIVGVAVENVGDAVQAIAPFLDDGVDLVALSLADQGLVLGTNLEIVHARPPHVQARNPVGAGDALVAGMVWALEQQLDMVEVARWGVAAGTAAAMRDGVDFGTRGEVNALYDLVSVSVY